MFVFDEADPPENRPDTGKMPPEQFMAAAKVITMLGAHAAHNYTGEGYAIAADSIAIIAGLLGEYAGCANDTCLCMARSIYGMMEIIHRREEAAK